MLQFKREIACTILREAAAVRCTRKRKKSGPIGVRPGDGIRYDLTAHYIKRRTERRLCNMELCKAKCVTYCQKCDRHVCIDHFQEYHTKK